MFTIGNFPDCAWSRQKRCGTTTGSAFAPAHTSGETGYRYYEASQFRDMFFILRCKDYGFTLEETAGLLHADAHIVAARFAAKYAQRKDELTHQRKLLVKMKEDMDLLKKGIDIMSTMKTEIKVVDTAASNRKRARGDRDQGF